MEAAAAMAMVRVAAEGEEAAEGLDRVTAVAVERAARAAAVAGEEMAEAVAGLGIIASLLSG